MSLWGLREFLRLNRTMPFGKKAKAILMGEYEPRKTCMCGYPLLDVGEKGVPVKLTDAGVILRCPDCGRKYMVSVHRSE